MRQRIEKEGYYIPFSIIALDSSHLSESFDDSLKRSSVVVAGILSKAEDSKDAECNPNHDPIPRTIRLSYWRATRRQRPG